MYVLLNDGTYSCVVRETFPAEGDYREKYSPSNVLPYTVDTLLDVSGGGKH